MSAGEAGQAVTIGLIVLSAVWLVATLLAVKAEPQDDIEESR